MSVAYIVVDKHYQSLAHALEDINDQLIDAEDKFSEEQLRVLDEAAPGPDPLVVPPWTDPLATAVKSTGPPLNANKNIEAARKNKFITFEKPAKGAGHPTPSARFHRHNPLATLDTNLLSVSFADSRHMRDPAESESEDAECSDSDSSDLSDYTDHDSPDNSGEEYSSDGSSEEHRNSHT